MVWLKIGPMGIRMKFYFQANYSDWWLGYLLWNSSEIDVSDSLIKIHEVVMWYYYLKLLILRHQGSLDWENIIMGLFSLVSVGSQWRHNDHDCASNHQPRGCLLNRLFRRRSKKTSELRVTGLCVGNSPGPVNSPHKGPVTRKMFPFDDVIMGSSAPGCFTNDLQDPRYRPFVRVTGEFPSQRPVTRSFDVFVFLSVPQQTVE